MTVTRILRCPHLEQYADKSDAELMMLLEMGLLRSDRRSCYWDFYLGDDINSDFRPLPREVCKFSCMNKLMFNPRPCVRIHHP